MDVVLSLLPDARMAVAAVARMAEATEGYPIRSVSAFARALGVTERSNVGGHVVDPTTLRTYLTAGDLPIEDPLDLANVVLAALGRCRQHQALRQSLEEFESALLTSPDTVAKPPGDAKS